MQGGTCPGQRSGQLRRRGHCPPKSKVRYANFCLRGEMVWYNITAYNIKVKFVLRNNKEKVICNNKNAEGEMQMKCSKNLERAIVLGLILSTGVCGSAWAYKQLPDDGHWEGIMNTNGEGVKIEKSGEFDSINVNATGVPANYNNSTNTTTALRVNSASEVTVNGPVNIINMAMSNAAMPEQIDNNNALFVRDGATFTINGGENDVFIAAIGGSEGLNSSAAISAKFGAGKTNTVNISGNNVKIIGNIDFQMNPFSDAENDENNFVNLNLSSANSYFYGDITDTFNFIIVSLKQGTATVSLNDSAEWIYDENSSIENLELNGGIVNLNDSEIKEKYKNTLVNGYVLADYRSTDPHKSVTIENLKGTGGIFKVDLDWNANQGKNYGDSYLYDYYGPDGSDYIYIEKVEGTDSKQIVDFDASKAHLENMEINKDKLYFANVADGDTSFTTASSVYSNAGNVFDYTYGTGSETEINDTDTDWYIAVSGKSAESNPNFSAAKGAMYAGYALGTELDTLNKRMGEARYLEEDDGVWVRYRHSKTGWDDTYETNGDMFQLGFDNEVTEKDGKHYRGVAIDYTDADTNIMGISGEGEHERYAVSLYDTWLGEKGHYRDLVLRGGRINSDYDVSGAFSNGYEDIGGDYHQWFGSISAEWGRKNDMGTGWYFEPQVQAQLARVGGASYVSDSGIDVDQDGATSLIGRAGFRIGREYVKDNGKHDNFYIKADLLHEFAGDKSFSLTGNDGRYDKEYDGQETWCDVGIGADISLGKNSYFWADVERTFGADFDNTWQVNGGFRWEF